MDEANGYRNPALAGDPLYARLLANAWSRLPVEIRDKHRGAGRAQGRATVERGARPLARLAALILHFPKTTADTPISVQFDVCVGGGATAQVPLNGACPAGLALIPTYLYAFRAELPGFAAPTYVPEPTSLLLLGVGLAAAGATRRRR